MTYLDIISRIMNFTRARLISEVKEINSYQPLEIQIGTEQTECEILASELDFSMLEYLGDLLINLDYLVYTPFGRRGTKYIIEKYNIDPIKFKITETGKILKENGIFESEDLPGTMQRFYEALYSNQLDLNNIEETAAAIRQISGEIDSLKSHGKIIGLKERDRLLQDILDQIDEDITSSGSRIINIEDYLPKVDINEPLNEEEIEYMERVMAIILPKQK